ncbi:helix-turn-helix transcriptional regulator [Methylobacterium crusticola]|uniref:helix-turn-helix transcriptional regulator n=1 Tax=Methylobacterium crusticola TaxID=1697972 RepID=UPI000FFB2AA4|nr:PAS and helix-turn-helix domain-containing protein [Methylobacterium crusticola]
MTVWHPAASAALDALALAVIVTDRQGRVLHANREAGEILGRTPGTVTDLGALGARSAEGRGRLLALIQAACDRGGAAGGFLHLPGRGAGDPGVSVCVVPLSEDDGPGRAMIVARLLRPPARAEAQLRTLFGLTRAEAQVGAALARGASLVEISEALGTSLTTVRTHVARIFVKTGTRQQSQLVALVAAFQLPVASDGDAAPAPAQALRSSR